MNNLIRRCAQSIGQYVDAGDVVFTAGVASVGYGLAQIYEPAAWIVVGAIGITMACRGQQ